MNEDINDYGSDEESVSLATIVKTYGSKKSVTNNSLNIQQIEDIIKKEVNTEEVLGVTDNSFNIQQIEDTIKKEVNSEEDEINVLKNGDNNAINKKALMEKQLVADGKVLGCLFCGVCEFQTNVPTFMNAHMRKHTRKKNVICEKCFRRFKKGIELINHVRTVHRKIQYICSVCNYITNEQSVLREHCLSHKDISLSNINIEKTMIILPNNNCTICGFEFVDKLLLKEHMKLHDGNQAFTCTVCRNQFKAPGDMKRIENTINGLFQFQCKCKYKYTLINPIKGKMKLSEEQRPFHCGICPCKFKNPYVLSTHLKSHLERTAYKCNHCSNTYRMLAHLESHMRAHRNNPS